MTKLTAQVTKFNIGNIIRPVIFAIGFIILVYFFGYILRPTDEDYGIKTVRSFYQLPEESAEVMAFGASHIGWGLDAVKMYRDHGIGIYMFSTGKQALNTTELFIKDASLRQSPKLVLIETGCIKTVNVNIDTTYDIYVTRELPFNQYKIEYLRECFGDDPLRFFTYYFQLFEFHDGWSTLNSRSFKRNTIKADITGALGQTRNSGSKEIAPITGPSEEQLEFPHKSLEVLDRITAFCSDNDIEILFVTMPHSGEEQYTDASARYAKEHGYLYLNLFDHLDEMNIDYTKDFKDSKHMSLEGSAKAADMVSIFIKDNYSFITDMREVEGNAFEAIINE